MMLMMKRELGIDGTPWRFWESMHMPVRSRKGERQESFEQQRSAACWIAHQGNASHWQRAGHRESSERQERPAWHKRHCCDGWGLVPCVGPSVQQSKARQWTIAVACKTSTHCSRERPCL
jgi:hypothetical protein